MGTTTSANVVKVIFDDGATAAPTSVLAFPFESTFEVDEDATDAIETTVVIADEALNGPTLTYQWFAATGLTTAGGVKIDGATDATFSPDTDAEGTFYYYVVVSNSKGTAMSNVVKVAVEAACCDLHIDGMHWIILTTDGEYTLITTAQTVSAARYNSGSNYIAYANQAGDVGVRATVNTWYRTTNMPTIKSRAHFPDNLASETAYNTVQATAISAPAGPAGTETADVAFLLSWSEISTYQSIAADRTLLNWSGNQTAWWLRSPGTISTTAGTINATGNLGIGDVAFGVGVRPAIWIK